MTKINTIKCQICGKTIPNSVKTKTKGRICGDCRSKYKKLKAKMMAVEYKGGKCEKCGYNKSLAALDFHHIDPCKKDFNIGSSIALGLSWETVKKELDKCILLCSNCHREEHNLNNNKKLLTLNIDIPIFVEKEIKDKKERLSAKTIERKRQQRKNYENQKELRKELIINSKIDFSEYGWGLKLAKILGISSISAVRWIKRNMPDFYKTQCFQERLIDEKMVQNIIKRFNEVYNIGTVAKEFGLYYKRVQKILKENNVYIKNSRAKCVYMIDDNTKEKIKHFYSIQDAALYIIENQISLEAKATITRKITQCARGEIDNVYGYKWVIPNEY